ncbi:MAG: SurA N-terminal domain-containing protein [Candidatus Eisenbacteria bacterium]|nr:SurA N-terminal domain-containing protein [Candidatus Eisenbacteria bacterium]
MGLFETMRENTKAILWVTVIAFVALIFLAWGADFATQGRGKNNEPGVLGRVNGDPIYARDFSQAYEQARASYESQTGQPADEAASVELSAGTWDQLVDRALMRQAAEKYGLIVTDQEIANALLRAPLPRFRTAEAFKNAQGQFDIQRYQSWVADPSTNTLPLEQEYRELLLVQKLRLLAFSAVKVSNEEVREEWLNQNRKANIGYVQVPYYRIRQEEPLDDSALESYMRDHPDEFRTPPRVVLDYVKVEKRPSPEDTIDARAQMAEAVHEIEQGEPFLPIVQAYSEASRDRWGGETGRYFKKEELSPPALAEAAFSLPVGSTSGVIAAPDGLHLIRVEDRRMEGDTEQVKIAEIFVPIRTSYDTNAALQERLLDLVDSTGATTFREAAQTAELPLESTGPFDPEGMIPGVGRVAAAKEFAAKAQVGQTSRPVETSDAWFVFHLAEQRPAETPPLEEIRRNVRNAYLREHRRAGATAIAQRVLDRARSGLTLEQAAKADSGAVYNRVDGVIPHGPVRGLGFDAKLSAAVFTAEQTGLLPEVVVGNQAAFVLEILASPTFDESIFQAQKEETRRRLLEQRQTAAAEQWMDYLRAEAKIEDHRTVISSM